MHTWTLVFLVIALVAATLGFFGIDGNAAIVAKLVSAAFLIACAVSLVSRRHSRL